jgi:hypothetical protein
MPKGWLRPVALNLVLPLNVAVPKLAVADRSGWRERGCANCRMISFWQLPGLLVGPYLPLWIFLWKIR